ncbi:Solute carrier family 22 member 21 [Halotydeus destructor]|nr:Solute carrier family 22 member 21 [Halotydeus destructor]
MAEEESPQDFKGKNTKPLSKLDAIFADHIGNGGKFQYLLIGYITFLIGPMVGFNLTNQLLILLIPPHQCSDVIFQLPLTAMSNATAMNIELNGLNHNSTFDHCDKQLVVHLDEVTFDTKYSFRCHSKREFDHSIIYPTLVSENEWVCEDKHKALMPHVVFRAGSVLGMLVIGVLSDRFGRIPTSMFCFTLSGLANIATIFTGSSFTAFLICRALVGFVTFKGMIPVILATEFVGPKERAYVASGLQLSVGVTSITLPWISYFVRDWRIMMAITSGSMLLIPVISCFIPESVRWLLSRGGEQSLEKAKAILSKIARINGTDIPADVLDGLKAESKESKESFWSIFAYKRFMLLFSLTTLVWFLIAMVSWGGNLYVAILTDHPFLMISVNSALDVMATFCSQFFANFFGRRNTVIVGGVYTFVIYVATAFVPTENKYLFFSLLFLGRLGVTIVYNVKYLYAVELFPTAIRARALAVRLSFGCIGGLLSPYVLLLNFSGKSSPLVFYGAMCLLMSALMYFLPETRDAALPDTLAEANDFGLTKDSGDNGDPDASGQVENKLKRKQSFAVAMKRASSGPEIKYRDSVDLVYSTRRMSIYH